MDPKMVGVIQDMLGKVFEEFNNESQEGFIEKERAKQLISIITQSQEELKNLYVDTDFEEAYVSVDTQGLGKISIEELVKIAVIISENISSRTE